MENKELYNVYITAEDELCDGLEVINQDGSAHDNNNITSSNISMTDIAVAPAATNINCKYTEDIDKMVMNKINNDDIIIDNTNDKRRKLNNTESPMKMDCSMKSKNNSETTLFDDTKEEKIIHYNRDNKKSVSSKSSGIDKGSTLALSIDRSSAETISSEKNDTEYNSDSWLSPDANTSRGQIINTIDNHDEKSNSKSILYDIIDDNLDIETRDIGNETRTPSPKIPDGGWGWMVVMASLIISMIADGVSFSFGLLYIEFLHEFGASKARTAWIGSLFMAVPLLSGPIMSALVDRYGCRNMTIIGGLVSGFGFVLSSFSNSIEVMYLTFGVLAGLGLGLCYVTAVVSIAYWFDKKRTLAVSLGACGTGIGTFVYAPMTAYFIEEYGWRGTCLLLAGSFFNLIVCGAIMQDPEWWIAEQNKQQTISSPRKSLARSDIGRSYSAISTEEFPGVDELRQLLKSGKAPEYLLQSLRTSIDAPNKNEGVSSRGCSGFRSVVNLPTFVRQSEKVPLEVLESLSANSRLYNVILENYPTLLLCRSISDKKLDESPTGEITNKTGVTMSMRIKQATDKNTLPTVNINDNHPELIANSMKPFLPNKISKMDFNEPINPIFLKIDEEEKPPKNHSRRLTGIGGPVVRTDSLPWLRRQFSTNTHYFKDIRVHRNSVMYRGAVLNLHKYRLRASSCPNIYKNSMTTLAKESEEKWYTELMDLLRGMMDFSMFLEFHFLLLSLSTILLFTWFIVPYFYLAEHLTRNGYSEADGAQLLSIIGITNTVGMVGLGWAGDQSWMNVSKTYTACLIACGIATIFMSIFTRYYVLLIISSALFGLFFASNFSFTPVILVELIPLERFTTAYGLSLLCQGIGNLLGPPLAGWIFDLTNSWDLSFLMAGGWIIVAGLLMGIIPYTKNRKIWGSGPVEMERIGDRDSVA
ncbi:hypothetical protein PV325_004437 [Microctonus aethiopoides]|uniref:Major facilitator superfamily (MFS) profile domain-containing protein n=2 Tax=Microctonus aethiopoides TaxID=144406 RepID=A0AA39KTN8_9HYME|nr:hypothetical protein PV325_004437 [Microctonus aethiopoides]KAK0173349.1 hypothetical protein PV328_006563 [Microctonus aethiopoides]